MSLESKINISSKSSDWRGIALSNFTMSPFVLEEILFASVEGFIQGIKFPSGHELRTKAFVSSGWDAKLIGEQANRAGVYWGGSRLEYGSSAHHRLIREAIRARIWQSEGLQAVLLSTDGTELVHETGMEESPTTSLPNTVFLTIMNELRAEIVRQRLG